MTVFPIRTLSRRKEHMRSMARPLTLGIALLALSAAGCRGGGALSGPAPVSDPLSPLSSAARLYYDNGGGIADSVRVVVRDAGAWEELWARATSRQASPPDRPSVDFSDEMVVAVGAGRMTPQDRIQVDSAGYHRQRTVDGIEEEYFVVVVRTIEGCRRLEIDAFPLEIVKVPRFDGPVRWEERRERPTECEQTS
jgi:hypothetical protein